MDCKKIFSVLIVVSLSVGTLPSAYAEEFDSLLGDLDIERVHQIRKLVRDQLKEENQLEEADLLEMTVEEIREASTPIVFHENDENEEGDKGGKKHPPVPQQRALILDDGDEGYSEKGHWDHFPLSGYEGDFHYIVGTNPIVALFLKAKSTWNFQDLQKGKYDVYVTWDAYEALAKDVTYKISSQDKNLSKVEVNQTEEPRGISHNGHVWQILDTVKIQKGANIQVELGNQANGFVVADAAMVIRSGGGGGDDEAELSLSKPEIYPQPAEGAGIVTVSQIIANAGPAEATGVVFKGTIPDSLSFNADNSDGSCQEDDELVICKGFPLSTPLKIAFTIPNGSDSACQEETRYYAKVTADQHDPILANNSREATINIICGNEANGLRIGIDGPPSQDYARDDNDAVLANVTFAQDERVTIQNMYVLVEGLSANGEPISPDITTLIEDFEIRNTVTGRTIDGLPIGNIITPEGTKLYWISDLVTQSDNETWQIRTDFINNGSSEHPKNGDKFRVHVCTSSVTDAPDEGCNFGGIFTPHPDYIYNLDARYLESGEPVRNIAPGGTVSGNFQRINTASFTVSQKFLNSDDTTVENAKDVTLLRFEGRAGETEDLLFTKAIFGEGSDPRNLANIQNYALWVDTDNDGVVDTIMEDDVAFDGAASVIFADLAGGGYVVPKEETVVFEVHGDITSSLTSDQFQLSFGTASTPPYIEVEELDDGSALEGIETDGSCLVTTCEIIVSTVESTIWTLVSQGDLYMTQDSTPVRNRQYIGGTLGEAALRLELLAEIEDIDVTDLQITVEGDMASIDRLELFTEGESNPFALATRGGCGSDTVPPQTFCANMESRQLVVSKGEHQDVLVRPRIKSDSQGGVSGDSFSLFVNSTPVSDESTGEGALRARGDESSNNLLANDEDTVAEGEVFIGTQVPGSNADITGRENDTVMTKIVSITNANPDANGTGVPVGTADIGQFKIAAAAHNNSNNGNNDVVLDDVLFNVNATNVEIDGSSFLVFNKSDSLAGVTCLPKDSDGNLLNGIVEGVFLVECTGLSNSPVDSEIDEGDDQTFVLSMDITNPNASPSGEVATLQVSLQQFENRDRTVFGTDSDQSHIQWLDQDGGSSTSFTWVEYPETTINSTTYQS